MSDILQQIENLDYNEEYTERPNFNEALPRQQEEIITESEVSFEKQNFTFNDILPLIIKSLTSIYTDFSNGVNIKDCFIKEDRLLGILLIFSIVGIIFLVKNNNNFQ